MNSMQDKCSRCGSKGATQRGRECVHWGRKIVLCDECAANRTTVPSAEALDAANEGDADPDTLCANWRKGCNGVTTGAVDGHLIECDACNHKEG